MEFFDSIAQVNSNKKNLKKWEQEQKNIELRRKELAKKNPATREELERAKSLGRVIVDAVDITDDYSETSAQKMEMATEFMAGMATLPLAGLFLYKAMKPPKGLDFFKAMSRQAKWGIGGSIALFALSIPLTFWATQKQKEASRISRFIARDKELNNPKFFVEYTPEQIKQAQEIAKNIPDEKEEKENKFFPFSDTFKLLSELSENKNAYKEWAENRPREEARDLAGKRANTSSETLAIAMKDKDVITRVVKKINMYAEEYSENTETAVASASMLSMLAGMAAGGIAAGITYALQKINLIPKEIPFLKTGVAGFFTIALPLAVPILANKYIIKSAQIGRFKAKQELMEDPNNFIYHDQQEMESVKDIEAPKEKEGIFKTNIDNIKFFFKLLKDSKEYNKYKKEQEKEDNKLRKALLQVEVTDEQLKRAKNLQEKVFNVFEKSDEMWQRYSEDAESATKIYQEAVITGSSLLMSIPAAGWIFCTETKMGQRFAERVKDFYDKPETQARLEKIGNGLKNISESRPVKFIGDSFSKIPYIGKHPVITAAVAAFTALMGATLWGTLTVQSKFTKYQKDAGKIGFMKAMEELKDPVYFVDKYSTNSPFDSIKPASSGLKVISGDMDSQIQKIIKQKKASLQTAAKPQNSKTHAANDNNFIDRWVVENR